MLADRGAAGMSLENMYIVHLDSVDKQASRLFIARREGATLAKTLLSTGSEKRICHACSRDALIGRETAEFLRRKMHLRSPQHHV